MSSKQHWSPGSDVVVQSVERSESGGWIVSGVLAPNGICPDCGLHSRRRHGWRRRRLQDYPAHGDGVTVDLAVCRWRCLAPACPRRTFSDQIASIARPFARRTSRVGEVVSHLGYAAGGRPAERLLHRLGLGVSEDTVLRQLKKRAQSTRFPRSSQPRCASNPADSSPRIRRGKSTRSRPVRPPSQRCAASPCGSAVSYVAAQQTRSLHGSTTRSKPT